MMRDRTRTTLALCVGISAVITGCASAPPTPTGNEGTAAQKPGAGQEAKPPETPATAEALPTRPPMRTIAELTEGFSNAPLVKADVLRPGVPTQGAQAEKALTQAPTQLEVKYAKSTLGVDKGRKPRVVYVRTYNGKLIGPTIRARPGERLRIKLENNLPTDPADRESGISLHGGHGVKGTHEGHSINKPHGFNITNLHTHGLHVSPDFPDYCKNKKYKTDEERAKQCNASDNVLISIGPGESQRYDIQIPRNHPPGTHWYHAHKHGAVAMQVATGMAGALIIEGGIDDLAELKNANEQVMVFQQIAVTPCGRKKINPSDKDKGGASEDCTVYKDQDKKTIEAAYESCDDYFKGISKLEPPFPKGAWCVENFDFVFGPGKWQGPLQSTFGFRTSINGQIGPVINAKQGELLRWRMVHGGIRETIRLAVVPTKDAERQQRPDALMAADSIKKRLPLWIVAYDGITTGRLDPVDNAELQPGYRLDTLLRVDEPGDFYLIDVPTSEKESLRAEFEPLKILATLHVDRSDAPPAALPKVEALEKLVPDQYKHVEDQEVKGCQYATFNIENPTTPSRAFQVNGKVFDPNNPPRTMELGTAEEWVVNSSFISHPFHIHVNPFEIVDGYDSIPKGTWKDTLLVNQNKPVHLRTRYTDFTGKFVLHCHILDHEDQGMMEMVEVVAKGAKSSRCPTLAGPNLCAPTPPTDGSCGDAQPGAPKK